MTTILDYLNFAVAIGQAFEEHKYSTIPPETATRFIQGALKKLRKETYEAFCTLVTTKRCLSIPETEKFIPQGYDDKMFQLSDYRVSKNYEISDILDALCKAIDQTDHYAQYMSQDNPGSPGYSG